MQLTTSPHHVVPDSDALIQERTKMLSIKWKRKLVNLLTCALIFFFVPLIFFIAKSSDELGAHGPGCFETPQSLMILMTPTNEIVPSQSVNKRKEECDHWPRSLEDHDKAHSWSPLPLSAFWMVGWWWSLDGWLVMVIGCLATRSRKEG
jgi:hypothetical protein